MNVNLVKKENGYEYDVIDENGNIKVVSLKCDSNLFKNDHEIEDILIKENKFEHYNQELVVCKKEQLENKQNTIFGNISDIFLHIVIIGFFIIINYSPLSPSVSLLITLLLYTMNKSMMASIYGTRIGRYLKKKKLKSKFEQLEKEITLLEQSIKKLKEKTNYKVIGEVKALTSKQAIDPIEHQFDSTSINVNSNENEHIDSVGFQFSKKKRF